LSVGLCPIDDPKQRCPDFTLAKKLLAWTPHVQLREGLIKTIVYLDQLLSAKGNEPLTPGGELINLA
jgi:hypothetical protein